MQVNDKENEPKVYMSLMDYELDEPPKTHGVKWCFFSSHQELF